MGLPIFVAPVESDVSRKSANKATTTSPPRSSIRRPDRTNDRRSVARRAAARIYGPVQRTLSDRQFPWIESGVASENGAAGSDERMRSMQESIHNMARNDARRNQRMEEHLATVFRTTWDDLPPGPAEEERQDTDLGWWSIDPRARARRPRLLTPISSRFTRSPDGLSSVRMRYPGGPINTENLSPAETSRLQRIRLAQLAQNAYRRRRSINAPRNEGVDGLGDRERSLSPEGWDTLRTTLAPDPQPPSANTSFASAAGTQTASQSAVQPSGGSILPDGFDDAPVDAGCDSGCEHSDFDDGDFEEPRPFLAHQQRRVQMRQIRSPNVARIERPRSSNNINNSSAENTRPRRTSRSGMENSGAPNGPERQALHGVPIPETNSQDSWVGRALLGASEGEASESPRNATVTTVSSMTSAPAEEDWSGMQHIVRSLARREDIPEEWWAEAGLSRTLSRQGTN